MPLFTTSYLADSLSWFHYYKRLAERAMEQVPEGHLFTALDAESNSIAIIVKHLAGNMQSRWPGLLACDGETPGRDRDAEFEDPPPTRQALLALWEGSWECVFAGVEPLSEADLGRSVTIRGEAHSVMQAINRQLAHYAYHCGQIVLLSKHFAGSGWKALTIPRGQSAEFNRRVASGEATQR